ncbi:hypothetical protein FDECE_7408 [Fusarium decemcellulare]|nr:hypothetical protein FDECE_7408 [Fusarium decemcellulare]
MVRNNYNGFPEDPSDTPGLLLVPEPCPQAFALRALLGGIDMVEQRRRSSPSVTRLRGWPETSTPQHPTTAASPEPQSAIPPIFLYPLRFDMMTRVYTSLDDTYQTGRVVTEAFHGPAYTASFPRDAILHP